jgi:hypothetical protein
MACNCNDKSSCNCDDSCFPNVKIPVGPKGDKGDTGLIGPLGLTGAQGEIGLSGTTGAAGNNGSTGTTGPAGVQGLIGVTGSTGSAGSTGLTGANGTDGTDGVEEFFGSGVPAGGLGVDGDRYNDTTTTAPQMDVYQKQVGVWVLIGTFGNIVTVAPGAGAEDAYLFRALKVSNQLCAGSGVETIINFGDDSTIPNFDNAQVWSGFNWKTPIDTPVTSKFTIQGLSIENTSAGAINGNVIIHHYPAAGGGPLVIGSHLFNIAATTTDNIPLVISTPQVFLANDEVQVVVVPNIGVSDDLDAKLGGDFYIQD